MYGALVGKTVEIEAMSERLRPALTSRIETGTPQTVATEA